MTENRPKTENINERKPKSPGQRENPPENRPQVPKSKRRIFESESHADKMESEEVVGRICVLNIKPNPGESPQDKSPQYMICTESGSNYFLQVTREEEKRALENLVGKNKKSIAILHGFFDRDGPTRFVVWGVRVMGSQWRV
jgi:hypothetical protein